MFSAGFHYFSPSIPEIIEEPFRFPTKVHQSTFLSQHCQNKSRPFGRLLFWQCGLWDDVRTFIAKENTPTFTRGMPS